MSISGALSNAISGLTVSARSANVVSSNIANAMTEGYGVRRLEIASRMGAGDGAGARVAGVLRDDDPILTGERRAADAGVSLAAGEAAFLRRIEGLVGTPDELNSLSARFVEFEARLVDAANAPGEDARLGAAVEAAVSLADAFGEISGGIQAAREQADSAIAATVADLNQSLAAIAELNTRIRSTPAGGGDMAALLDAQARLVDRIAPILSIETRRDGNGALQIYSGGGEILVDRTAAQLDFRATPAIDASMQFGSSILSGVTIGGRDMRFGGSSPPLGGGRLEALFAQRDEWAPDAQGSLDALARDLAERFDRTGIDPTLAPGAAGLFTDLGAVTDPAAELGLAARLRVNAALLPEAGGAVWRLRDGLGAATPGATGDPGLIVAQMDALSARVVTASGGFSPTARSMSDLVSENASRIGLSRQTAETREANSATVRTGLHQRELARGVDTDAEMQALIRIEQMYAANARVVQAAQAMLDELMRATR